MKKILVITDMSANSKAGIRFAIQFASQSNYQLTFFHVYHFLRPTKWSDSVYTSFEHSEHEKTKTRLCKFVSSLYKSKGETVKELTCIVQTGGASGREIMQYAQENKFDYICGSRSGTGKTSMLFGSVISDLIKKCNVPVIAVPENYRRTPIKNIAYTSDLINVEYELKKVADFAGSVNAKVELLHFKTPLDYLLESDQFELIERKLKEYKIATNFSKINYEETLINNMNKVFEQSKPSMVIMFTKQNRSLFEKLFLSSISAEFAHLSKIPLLVFKKTTG